MQRHSLDFRSEVQTGSGPSPYDIGIILARNFNVNAHWPSTTTGFHWTKVRPTTSKLPHFGIYIFTVLEWKSLAAVFIENAHSK